MKTMTMTKQGRFWAWLTVLLLVLPPLALAAPSADETAGNNLSYPVIWAEGVTKVLPGTAGMEPMLEGAWMYQWGTNGVDPDVTPASCVPDPDEGDPVLNFENLPLCDDNVPGAVTPELEAGTPPADNPLPLAKAFLQKDALNLWQAEAMVGNSARVAVDLIDWGDNLESVDWYTNSQVRTEVVLFKLNTSGAPWLEYEMRHTDGWGIDEVHGLAVSTDNEVYLGPGNQATIYSPCARLTIQKLQKDRDDISLLTTWNPDAKLWEGDINAPIFNTAVYEAGDGPGYYSAEINVKGRIIYGYTWNVRKLNDMTALPGEPPTAAGDYRLTFSFDEVCGASDTQLNTAFEEGVTQLLLPVEETDEEVVVTGESDTGGTTPVLDTINNLTYIDVRILERGGGGGGGGNR